MNQTTDAASRPSTILPSNVTTADEAHSPLEIHADQYLRMRRELRSWAKWQVGLGLVNMLATGNVAWGLVLIGVGISSLWFRSSAMFVVYAATLAWAAVWNFTSITDGGTGWVAFSLVQLYIAFNIFRQFRVYQPAHRAFVDSGAVDRAARVFPQLSALLGAAGFIGLFVGVSNIAEHTWQSSSTAANLTLGLIIDAAVVAVALGLASLLSGFPKKALTILGLLTGGLALIAWVLIMFGV